MIREIHIKDYALIDELKVDLGPVLNVLTGETGAGKSIIIGALGLALGERSNNHQIRKGAGSVRVQLVCDRAENVEALLEQKGLESQNGEMLITRETKREGRNRCCLNDQLITLGVLHEIGEEMVDVHGQHEHQSLLNVENHLEILDRFAKSANKKVDFEKMYREYSSLNQKLEQLTSEAQDRERQIDLLSYQVKEIESARLKSGEEEELKAQRELLKNAEKVAGLVNDSYRKLEGSGENDGAIAQIEQVIEGLGELGKFDRSAEQLSKAVDRARIELKDAAENIRQITEKADFTPTALDEVESKLDLIKKLERKYGATVEDVIKFGKETRAKLELLKDSDEQIAQVKSRLNELRPRLLKVAAALTRMRQAGAEKLSKKVETELKMLGMNKAKFQAALKPREEGLEVDCGKNAGWLAADGADEVEFMISANPGEPLLPLRKIASGGEISRIMLAIKVILAETDNIPTLIFDELDAGIGGSMAREVAKKLVDAARHHQVICITHLPQIAAAADVHVHVEKETSGGRTKTEVNVLGTDEEKVAELARMFGAGKEGKSAKEHAAQLLKEMSKGK